MEFIGMHKPGCKHGISLLFVSLCMLIITVVGDSVKCTTDESICGCYFGNGNETHEISMLEIDNEGGPPFFSSITGTAGAFNYFINPCTGFTKTAACSDVTGCQQATDKSSSHDIAKPGTYSFVSGYTKGQPLIVTYNPVGGRQMTLSLVCTPSSDKDTATVNDDNANKYTVTISSKKVCPKPYARPRPNKSSNGGGLSTGSIFVIIFFVVLVIYLVAGILFMKYKRGATGKEVIPNVEFWSSIPGLVKDGCVFFGTKVKGLCQGLCQRVGYNEI